MRTTLRILTLALGVAAAMVAVAAGGCAGSRSKVAVVNIMTIESNWPKFQNYANQLQASFAAIEASKIPAADKRQQLAQLQGQTKRWQDEVTSELRSTVTSIAQARHYQLVVTREGTAFGGDDITVDVEKAMNIPTSSPSPGG
jgi:Skp family chaperone for outer membrane proteins